MGASSLMLVFPPHWRRWASINKRAAMLRTRCRGLGQSVQFDWPSMQSHRSPLPMDASEVTNFEQLLRRIARERIPSDRNGSRAAAKLKGSIAQGRSNWLLRHRRRRNAPLRDLLERVGEREQPWLATGAAREAHSEG